MNADMLIQQLRETQRYFDRSTGSLQEEDSAFTPAPGLWTAAQQVAHVARTVDWFFEGAFRPEGFDMDWEKETAAIASIRTLREARDWVAAAFDRAAATLAVQSPDDLAVPLPAGPVMGGEPRWAIVPAIADHTAHHRGALTVYARLCGHVPAMPYMEETEGAPA
jgi:uncharacterized damage-inducible protein DinB